MKTVKLNYLLLLILIGSCKSDQKIDISDGFESQKLSQIWSSVRIIPGALEIQSKIVRSGQYAAKITLNPNDQVDDEKGTILERSELLEAPKYTSVEDSNYSYAFSIFLPGDFPIVPTWLVIAQWKQYFKSNNCNPDNPILALRYESGEFSITLKTGPKKTILYRQIDDIRNMCLNFKFQIRFSREPQGRIIALLNGQKIIDYSGITAKTGCLDHIWPVQLQLY
jgi:hypothetical protein